MKEGYIFVWPLVLNINGKVKMYYSSFLFCKHSSIPKWLLLIMGDLGMTTGPTWVCIFNQIKRAFYKRGVGVCYLKVFDIPGVQWKGSPIFNWGGGQ